MPIHAKVLYNVDGSQEGETVYDHHGLLNLFLPKPTDTTWRYASFIDEYGTTRFNSLQIEVLLRELERLYERSPTSEWHVLLDQLRDLALRVRMRLSRYLEFIGD